MIEIHSTNTPFCDNRPVLHVQQHNLFLGLSSILILILSFFHYTEETAFFFTLFFDEPTFDYLLALGSIL